MSRLHRHDSSATSCLLLSLSVVALLLFAAACDLTPLRATPRPTDETDEQVLSAPPEAPDDDADDLNKPTGEDTFSKGETKPPEESSTTDPDDASTDDDPDPIDPADHEDSTEVDDTADDADVDEGGTGGSGGGGGTPPPPPPPPPVPFQATLSVYDDDAIAIEWNDPVMTPTGFAVLRINPQGSWLFRGQTDPQGRAFHEEQLLTNEVYCYQVVAYDMTGDVERTEPVCVPLPPPVYGYAPEPLTFMVHTESELRDAVAALLNTDVTIYVHGYIGLGGYRLLTHKSDYILNLVGVPDANGNSPVIDFQMDWDGNWDTAEPTNGIAFRNRAARVHGITFMGYESKGSAIRADVSEVFHAENCVFRDISTMSWPTRTGADVVTEADSWQGNVIGGGAQGNHIIIDHCTFQRAVLSRQYAHCVYLNSRPSSLTITNSTFELVGRPVVTSQPGIIRMLNNTYRNMQKVPSAQTGAMAWTYWVAPSDNHLTVMFERFENATLRWAVRSSVDPSRQVFERNDYSGLRIEDDDVAPGEWKPETSSGNNPQPRMDWPDWQEAGFDQHSKPPHGH